jgi:hypothetical protein
LSGLLGVQKTSAHLVHVFLQRFSFLDHVRSR